MRNILEVLDQMIAVMPAEVVADHQGAIDDVVSSIRYSAPEAMHLRWRQLHVVLVNIIGDVPTADWHFEVLSIWSTIPVSTIREEVARQQANGR